MLPYIIAGEVVFWCLLLGGLAVRYLLRLRIASSALLIATPVVDAVIIALTYVDLARGATSDLSHGLAAFYVGFSIVFGPDLVLRTDRRFAARFTDLSDDQLPAIPNRTSMQYWIRCILASSLTILLLVIGIVLTMLPRDGNFDAEATFWLTYWIIVAASIVPTWAVIGPLRDSFRGVRSERGADT